MRGLNDSIRKEAARLLQERLVDIVIGFQAGSLPMTAQPAIFRRAQLAGGLVSSGFGYGNLALYVTRRPRSERIGLICRGCESRAIRVLVGEQQKARENLYLIGIPCRGIIDRRKIEAETRSEVLFAEETDTEVIVTTRTKEYQFLRSDILHDTCRRCRFPQPVGVDVMLGEAAQGREGPPLLDATSRFDSLSAAERCDEFTQQAQRCIRCYACRQACPMCNCTQCFVDGSTPRWIESTLTPAGTQAWLIMRAFHQAGRCVACGACERACPMGIQMTVLTDKLNRDMEEVYGFTPGVEENRPLPFAAFSLEDAHRFEPSRRHQECTES